MIARIKQLIIKILLGKEVDIMAMVYVALIIKGKRTFESVPAPIKEQVREILIDLELEHLTVEEKEN